MGPIGVSIPLRVQIEFNVQSVLFFYVCPVQAKMVTMCRDSSGSGLSAFTDQYRCIIHYAALSITLVSQVKAETAIFTLGATMCSVFSDRLHDSAWLAPSVHGSVLDTAIHKNY